MTSTGDRKRRANEDDDDLEVIAEVSDSAAQPAKKAKLAQDPGAPASSTDDDIVCID